MIVKCSKCGETDLTQFWKNKSSRTGYSTWCKKCNRERARISTQTDTQKIKAQIRNSIVVENKLLASENKKVCCRCKEIFTFKKDTEIRCKSCESKKFKIYREKNLTKELLRQKEYREENRELINQKRRLKYQEQKGKSMSKNEIPDGYISALQYSKLNDEPYSTVMLHISKNKIPNIKVGRVNYVENIPLVKSYTSDETVAKIVELREQNLTYTQIAKQLGIYRTTASKIYREMTGG